MTFVQSLVIALVPTVGVAATVWASTRDLAVRRRLDGTTKFFEVVMVAHGRAINREGVGNAEVIAAIHLLADFGKQEKYLTNAARAALKEIETYTIGKDGEAGRAHAAVSDALTRLN